jgi:hypothetical protein
VVPVRYDRTISTATSSQYRPPRPVTGIALLYTYEYIRLLVNVTVISSLQTANKTRGMERVLTIVYDTQDR